jgi:hypothetical protein
MQLETPSELSIYPCTLYGRHRRWSADGTYHRVLDELRRGSGGALMRTEHASVDGDDPLGAFMNVRVATQLYSWVPSPDQRRCRL